MTEPDSNEVLDAINAHIDRKIGQASQMIAQAVADAVANAVLTVVTKASDELVRRLKEAIRDEDDWWKGEE